MIQNRTAPLDIVSFGHASFLKQTAIFISARSRIVVLLSIFLLSAFLPIISHNLSYAAGTEEIEASAQYILGDNDSKLDGRRLALMEAKRNALEKAGTYIESFTEVKNFQLTQDQIRIYAAGILELKESGEKWDRIGDNLAVTLTVKVKVDKDVVAKQIVAIRKNSEATQALEEAKAKIQEYERKIAEMNRELKLAKKPGTGSVEESKQPQQQIKDIQLGRNQALTKIDVETLLRKAAVALLGSDDENKVYALGTASSNSINRARMFIQEAFNLDPENPDVLTSLGQISIEEKDNQKAEKLFRKAISIDSTFAHAHHNLSIVLNRQGDIAGAELASRNAIRLKPLDATFHRQLGFILERKGDLPGAVRELREAVRLLPDNGSVLGGLGYVLYKQGNTAEGIQLLQKACELGDQPSCKSLRSLRQFKTPCIFPNLRMQL